VNGIARKVRVLIVDDSAVVREVMTRALSQDPQIEVIGAASDPIFARQRMERDWPDVILLDVEMPRMDGISFLKQLMAERPTPVVICSTLTEKGAATTMAALSAGAVSFVTKPKLGLKDFLGAAAREIAAALKTAAASRPRRSGAAPDASRAAGAAARMLPGADARPSSNPPPARGNPPGGESAGAMAKTTHTVIAIGASTGGTQAIESLLTRLPRVIPGIVIVQHMPERFTASLAERLDQLCEVNVRRADRTGRQAHDHPALWRLLRSLRDGRTAGQPAPAVGGRAVPQRRAGSGRQCDRHDHDRHGRRWRTRHARDARRRRTHLRPGRGELRGLRHAQGSDSPGRRR
jgi:two-component system chemotaxis response regulator CheB